MINQKSKNLHSITINGITITTRIRYNSNTNHISIGNTFNYPKNRNDKYYQNNKEQILKRCNQYYQNNKDKCCERRKQYLKTHNYIWFLGKNILTDLPKIKPGYHYHHVIYDHLNKDRYVMPMTRSKHKILHHQMKRNGIEISHINVRVNDFKGF